MAPDGLFPEETASVGEVMFPKESMSSELRQGVGAQDHALGSSVAGFWVQLTLPWLGGYMQDMN